MTKELNTLLTALYVLVDDHVVPPRTGRGRRPLLSDSELITLAVAQALLRYPSERRWIRHIHSSAEWQIMFPYLPGQSGYHKRLKNLQPLLCKAILALAACCPSWFDDVWIADATPVPCGMSRETGCAFRPGRLGRLWLLRLAIQALLGSAAAPGHHRARPARRVRSEQRQN